MDSTDHRTRVAAERRARMREALLLAGLQVMAAKGPGAATVDDIVQAAGVARGSFYNHFTTPDDLAQALGLALGHEVMQAVGAALDGLQDPAARVGGGLRALLALVRQVPVLGQFLIRSGWPSGLTRQAVAASIGVDLRAGIATGRFLPLPQDLAEALAGGIALGAVAVALDGADRDALAAEALFRALGLSPAEARTLGATPPPGVDLGREGLLPRLAAGA